MKTLFKYISRIVWAIITLYWGLISYFALTPMEEYPCEAGQEEMSPYWGVLITVASLIVFCIVWYKTKDWGVKRNIDV